MIKRTVRCGIAVALLMLATYGWAQESTPQPETETYQDDTVQFEYPVGWAIDEVAFGVRIVQSAETIEAGADPVRILIGRAENVFVLFEPELTFAAPEDVEVFTPDFVLGVVASYAVLADNFASATAIDAGGRTPITVMSTDRRAITMRGQTLDAAAVVVDDWLVFAVMPAGVLDQWQGSVLAVADSVRSQGG